MLGDVTLGLALLNEAGVATVSGELDPVSTGLVYCELVCALQALGQYDLADEWTEATGKLDEPFGGGIPGCR